MEDYKEKAKMLSTDTVTAAVACDRVPAIPMETNDDNCNNCTTATASPTATKHQLSDGNHNDEDPLRHPDADMLHSYNNLMDNPYPKDATGDDRFEDSFQLDDKNLSEDQTFQSEDPNTIEDENDDSDEIFIDTEEQLVNGDYGLSKLYLNEVEIDSREEEETITDLVNATDDDKLIQV